MRERPILFSTPMVRAILDGRKTQTRHVVKLQPRSPADIGHHGAGLPFIRNPDPLRLNLSCPYGQPGDKLWVRETFSLESSVEGETQPLPHNDGRPVKRAPVDDFDGIFPAWVQPHYRATDPAPDLCCERDNCRQCRDHDMGPHWRPSIHMPRWASRITLEVTGVRVERLNAISEADALAEGIDPEAPDECAIAFQRLWESINGPGSWDANPFVWVVEFKRITP